MRPIIVSALVAVVIMGVGILLLSAVTDSLVALLVGAFVLALVIGLVVGKMYPRQPQV